MRNGPPAAPLTNADTDRALAALERWAADSDRPVIVLAGATKSGKTVLLDVLASRLGRYFSVVYLSRAGSDPDEFSTRVLSELGEAPDGTPRLVLAREIERRADRPLIVLLDDADTLPPRVELWLFDLARRSAGSLRLVLALSDARVAREFAAAFHADTEIVSIGTSMGPAAAESYLRLVSVRASEAPLASFRRRAAADLAARTAPAPPKSEARAAKPAQRLPALASVAGPAPTRAPEKRPPATALPAQPRARVEPPPSPRADAPTGAARKGPRLRWIALAGALASSFVAGFFLSELRDAEEPQFVETVDAGQPAALPSVSASPATTPPEPVAAPPSPPAVQAPAAVGAPPAPDAYAGSAPLAVPPDPFTAPPLPEAALPLEGRDVGLVREDAPIASARAAEDPRPLAEGMAEARAPSADAVAPPPSAPAAAASELAPVRDDGAVVDAGAPVEAGVEARIALPEAPAANAELVPERAAPPAVGAAPPAVAAARPPMRPRLVKVQVQAEPGAEIRLGGRELGSSPVGLVELPPGAHRLSVRLPDGREVERIVEVQGTRYEIQVR